VKLGIVFLDGNEADNEYEDADPGCEVEYGAPGRPGSFMRAAGAGRKRCWGKNQTYLVNWVKRPPREYPTPPPIGAPAPKEAKAHDRDLLPAGNVCPRIPTYLYAQAIGQIGVNRLESEKGSTYSGWHECSGSYTLQSPQDDEHRARWGETTCERKYCRVCQPSEENQSPAVEVR
jgi:hypothetical protein